LAALTKPARFAPFAPHNELLGRKPSEFIGDIDQLDILDIQNVVSPSLKPAFLFFLVNGRFLYGIRIKETHCLQHSFLFYTFALIDPTEMPWCKTRVS